MLSVIMLNAIMLSVVMLNAIMLSVIMLNAIMLGFVMLNAIMLSVVMLSGVMLSGVKLNAVMLRVVVVSDELLNGTLINISSHIFNFCGTPLNVHTHKTSQAVFYTTEVNKICYMSGMDETQFFCNVAPLKSCFIYHSFHHNSILVSY
jgi:hypothetical protein